MVENPDDLDRQAPLGASSEIIRMLFVSALAVFLLAGGVYWLHHVPAQSPASDSGATTVQVQLLPTNDPTPFPLDADEPLKMVSASAASRLQDDTKRDVEPADDQLAVLEAPPVESPPVAQSMRAGTAETRKAARDRALKFQQALQRHIARYQRYPDDARERGLAGTVEVVFVLKRDGSVLDAWVKATSGQSIFDREAIATIHRAEPLPGIPSDLPDELSVLMPVAFELR